MGTSTAEDVAAPALRRVRRAIVVVDIVESVRLMQQHEDDVIERWRRFVHEVRAEVLPACEGRLVKSLGDGMLLEFPSAVQALAATRDLLGRISGYNGGRPADAVLLLRAGAHVADVVVDDIDIYGSGVNLAARLASLALPQELVVSVEFKDELLQGLDAHFVDMGECYLKHIERPHRAFKVQAVMEPAALPRDPIAPLLLVLPPQCDEAHPAAGAAADALAAVLARQPRLRVASRLATRLLGPRDLGAQALNAVRADYVVSGALRTQGDRLALRLVLRDTRTAQTVAEHAVQGTLASLFVPDAAWASQAAEVFSSALLAHQWGFPAWLAVPTLPSYALLLRAMSLLNRLSRDDAREAGQLLDALVERHPRAADARAWLAHWHLLQVAQNWTADRTGLDRAQWEAERALDHEADHPLAQTVRAHLLAFRDGQPQAARDALLQVVQAHPNEPMAWAFLGAACTHLGQGDEALAALDRAHSLSPFDPFMFLVELCRSCALSVLQRPQDALAAARRAVDLNAAHLSSLVQLMVAAVEAGQGDEARATAQRYLAIRPAASVQRFLDHHVARGSEWARRQGEALLEAGIPR